MAPLASCRLWKRVRSVHSLVSVAKGIVNLPRKVKIIAEVSRRKMLMGHGKWGIPMVRRRVLLQSLHPMFEIGPGKGDDILRQPNGDIAVGNAQKWGRRRRESVVPVWLM